MFEKEFKDFYEKREILRDKIIEYLDSLNEKFDSEDYFVWINDGSEDILIAEISHNHLETEDGFGIDYRKFEIDDLINLFNSILCYHADIKRG